MKNPEPWEPRNHLLQSLPGDVCHRLRSELIVTEMPKGKVLYEADAKQTHMYFPRTGVVSLLYVTEKGHSGEIAMVGNEGLVGTAVLVDNHSTPTRAEVLIAGEAWTLKNKHVDEEFRRGGPFQFVVLRYTQLIMAQMAQTTVCSRHHSMEQQMCRWLLQALDRIDSNELTVTQETIANLLGVRREGISEAAGRLKNAGLIRYSRGIIEVLDRYALESRSCECYRIVKRKYDRLLSEPVLA